MRFRVSLDKGNMMFARKRGLLEAFNLVSRMPVETLNLLNQRQELRLFDKAEDGMFFFFCTLLLF